MEYLNRRISLIAQSATLRIKAKAAALAAEGKDIVDLSAGELDCSTPRPIIDAAYEALVAGKTRYTEVAGIKELQEALLNKLKVENGLDTSGQGVIVTNGGKQAIFELFDVCLEEGDEVIIPSPYWVSYPSMVQLCRGVPVVVKTTEGSGYRLTPQILEEQLNEKTRVLVINSPSNPTGAGYTADDFKALGEVINSKLERGLCKRLLILSDEVYEKIVFPGFSFVSFASAVKSLANRTITVNAFSKSHAMTGWRAGYAFGPKEVISAMSKYQSQSTSNVSTAAQYGALAALKMGYDFLNPILESLVTKLNLSVERLNSFNGLAIKKFPDGAFYLFVRIDELLAAKKISSSTEFGERLIADYGVAVVPGVEFGDDGAFRLSVASPSKQVADGVDRIGQFVAKL